MIQTLRQRLEHLSQPAVPLALDGGTRLLVTPGNGRLLGLYPPRSEANFLWVNPALSPDFPDPGFFEQPGWTNPGGDRTWLAPEIEVFIEDLARPWETYTVQRALDPGSWKLASASGSELTLTSETRVRLHRSGREVGVRLTKTYRAAANPLLSTSLANAGMDYAGYTQVTTLQQESDQGCEIRLGIWNLLQLPSPGLMMVPSNSPVQPCLVFGKLTNGECQAEQHMVRWEMQSRGINTKIAIKPQSLTGRAGYLRQLVPNGMADLVVREFAVDPDGDYVDRLWEPPHENGWAFQACCVREGGSQFNELEYHAAVPPGEAGLHRDESRVWAFRGPTNVIAEAATLLLGATLLQPNPRANQ